MNSQPASSAMRTVAALLLVLGLVGTACGSNETNKANQARSTGTSTASTLPPVNTETPVEGGSLVYGLFAETNGWDPTTSQWGPWGLTVARTFFDTLTVFDEKGEIHPYLAKSFTPNADFTEWTITLRPGITFHNGEKLTAQVLKDNWDFFTASPLTARIFDQITDTEVVSDLVMKAHTKHRWVNFPKAWTTQIGVVMAPQSLEGTAADRAQHPIGTGPFTFDQWQPDKFLRVVKNDDYWQKGLPHLNEIEFRPIIDPTSRAQALLAGDIDAAYMETNDELKQFRGNSDYVIWQDPAAETAESFVMLNSLQAPLDDPDVRRALVYATDKKLVNQIESKGTRELANGPYRPSSPWYQKTDYPQYDLAKAKQLVASYEAEHGPITFTLEVGTGGTDSVEVAQALQEQWKRAGIDVTLGSSEIASLIVKVVQGDYQAVVWRQFDSPHPLQETVWWHQDGAPDVGEVGLNFARNRDEVLSAALDKARTVTDQAAEKQQYDIVQAQLSKDLPYVWLTHIDPSVVARKDVVNVLYATVPDTELRAMSFMNSAHSLAQVWIRNP